jgi:hypothetical protein
MASLYITEYALMGQTPNAGAQMPQEAPQAEQTVAIGGGSTQSAFFQASTRFVRIHCDSVCSVKFGQNPAATATSARLAANQTEYHAVPEGGNFRVAVIANV